MGEAVGRESDATGSCGCKAEGRRLVDGRRSCWVEKKRRQRVTPAVEPTRGRAKGLDLRRLKRPARRRSDRPTSRTALPRRSKQHLREALGRPSRTVLNSSSLVARGGREDRMGGGPARCVDPAQLRRRADDARSRASLSSRPMANQHRRPAARQQAPLSADGRPPHAQPHALALAVGTPAVAARALALDGRARRQQQRKQQQQGPVRAALAPRAHPRASPSSSWPA